MTLSSIICEIDDGKTLVIMELVYIYFINKQDEIRLVHCVVSITNNASSAVYNLDKPLEFLIFNFKTIISSLETYSS